MKQRYVVGFLFGDEGHAVALIRKNRPAWQAGKLNGVGGKVEVGETFTQAMIREFYEETGVSTEESDWQQFVFMYGSDFHSFELMFFRAFNSKLLQKVKTTTDEKIEIHSPNLLLDSVDFAHNAVPNLRFLIPMALTRDMAFADIRWEEKK